MMMETAQRNHNVEGSNIEPLLDLEELFYGPINTKIHGRIFDGDPHLSLRGRSTITNCTFQGSFTISGAENVTFRACAFHESQELPANASYVDCYFNGHAPNITGDNLEFAGNQVENDNNTPYEAWTGNENVGIGVGNLAGTQMLHLDDGDAIQTIDFGTGNPMGIQRGDTVNMGHQRLGVVQDILDNTTITIN
jgi:hypothetical protein